jgi:hypothetical protein
LQLCKRERGELFNTNEGNLILDFGRLGLTLFDEFVVELSRDHDDTFDSALIDDGFIVQYRLELGAFSEICQTRRGSLHEAQAYRQYQAHLTPIMTTPTANLNIPLGPAITRGLL